MTKTFIIKDGQKPTEEMYKEVEKAKEFPIEYDKDSPKLSPAMKKAFECSVKQRNRRKDA